MNYVYHRGEYVSDNQATIAKDNRAFRFGDGFFETMRVFSGKVLFLENHMARIVDTLSVLKIIPPENFSVETLRNQIQGLIKRNKIEHGGRVRVTFYRKSTGFYMPKSDDLGIFIEADAIMNNDFELSHQGKMVDIYPDMRKDLNRLSVFKTLNTQLYVMSALYAREKSLDESLIQNAKLAIIESTSSNIFIVSNGVLYTPSIEDGCIAGTMRMNIINLALEQKIKVYECTINPHNLLTADEFFLTNAAKGIEWVVGYRTKRYYNDMAKRLIAALNESSRKYVASQS
jgi:branched-subunit amino acid aminotransferase/4-amino-4-deoxychorismate lyase